MRVSGPFIAPDEMTYAELGRSLWSSGALEVFGHHVDLYSVVYPTFAGLPLSLGGVGAGFTALKLVQSLVISLAAIPVYLWARRAVSTGPALVAAALTLALPGLAYSSLIMTEVVFYPIMALTTWRIAVALADSSWRNDGLALATIVLALLTRIQAVALVPALLVAIALLALLERSNDAVRRSRRLLSGVTGLAVVWLLWRILSGGALLGVYTGAAGGYRLGHAALYVGYHLADLLLLVAIVPVCSLVLLTLSAYRIRERELAALVVVAIGLSLSLVVEVGVFASNNVHHLAERDLLGAAPALFVVFAVWIGRGYPRPRVATYLTGAAAATVLLFLPVGRLSTPGVLHDGLTLVLLVRIGGALGGVAGAYSLVVALLVLAFVLLPRRIVPILPLAMIALLAAGAFEASRYVADRAAQWKHAFPGGQIGWIDAATREPVVYLYHGDLWDFVWQQIFWNRTIEGVYILGPGQLPGPVPQVRVHLRADGRLVTQAGTPVAAPQVVAITPLEFVGEPIRSIPVSEVAQSGLTLWKVEPPLRLSTMTTGVLPNGDIPARATFDVYGCRGGRLLLTLVGKQDARIKIRLDGKLVQDFHLVDKEIWRGRIPTPLSSNGVCRYTIAVSGYTGSTTFLFERSS
jgi:hypothetical protein